MFIDKNVIFVGLGKPPETQGTARPDGAAASSNSGGSNSGRAGQPSALAPRAADLAGGRGPHMGGRVGSHLSGRQAESDAPSRAAGCGGAACPLRPGLAAPAARGAPGGPAPREVVRGPRPTRAPPEPEMDATARGGSRDF